ncbi:MAG TPA: hypothetical protein VIT68_04510 [Candidatus Gracilibacteria bacterium]
MEHKLWLPNRDLAFPKGCLMVLRPAEKIQEPSQLKTTLKDPRNEEFLQDYGGFLLPRDCVDEAMVEQLLDQTYEGREALRELVDAILERPDVITLAQAGLHEEIGRIISEETNIDMTTWNPVEGENRSSVWIHCHPELGPNTLLYEKGTTGPVCIEGAKLREFYTGKPFRSLITNIRRQVFGDSPEERNAFNAILAGVSGDGDTREVDYNERYFTVCKRDIPPMGVSLEGLEMVENLIMAVAIETQKALDHDLLRIDTNEFVTLTTNDRFLHARGATLTRPVRTNGHAIILIHEGV